MERFALGVVPFRPALPRAVVHVEGEPQTLSPPLEAEAARVWDARRRTGALLFDGPLVSYRGHDARADALAIRAAPSSYRRYILSRDGKVPGEWAHANRPLAAGALLTLGTGEWLLGRRGAHLDVFPGRVSAPGGWVDPALDRAGESIDPSRTILRELDEELGIREDEVMALRLVGMVLGATSVYLGFAGSTHLTPEDLARRSPKDEEFSQLLAVPPPDAARMAADALTPDARALVQLAMA